MTGSDGGATAAARLARVTYLPGVVPPSEPVAAVRITPASDTRVPDAQTLERLRRIVAPAPSSGAEPAPETPGERSARAHNVSMHALTRRGMSSTEMRDLLKARELDENEVEVEVGRLEAVGLLDDSELARTLVRTLQERKGLGRSAITAELRRRRVDPVAVEEALSELDGDDELTRARELAVKRAPQLRSLDAETARRRLGAFLMRKGYSGSVVTSAVASALNPAVRSSGASARGPRFE